jgi:hypothetical protein
MRKSQQYEIFLEAILLLPPPSSILLLLHNYSATVNALAKFRRKGPCEGDPKVIDRQSERDWLRKRKVQGRHPENIAKYDASLELPFRAPCL